jgi:hypothetical protein
MHYMAKMAGVLLSRGLADSPGDASRGPQRVWIFRVFWNSSFTQLHRWHCDRRSPSLSRFGIYPGRPA